MCCSVLLISVFLVGQSKSVQIIWGGGGGKGLLRMGFKRSCLLMQSRFSLKAALLGLGFLFLLIALFFATLKEEENHENTSENVEIGSVGSLSVARYRFSSTFCMCFTCLASSAGAGARCMGTAPDSPGLGVREEE